MPISVSKVSNPKKISLYQLEGRIEPRSSASMELPPCGGKHQELRERHFPHRLTTLDSKFRGDRDNICRASKASVPRAIFDN